MNQVPDITKHVRGKHLNFAQRAIIQVRLQDGWSPYRIAKELGCCSNTIRNEIKRGTPSLYWGNTPKYDAVHAHSIYEGHRKSECGERFPHIFKTITTDNGSEFSRLAELELESETKVYYAHPYSSYEKGSNERHNGLLRHFFPKGRRIDSFSDEDVLDAENWINSMPRKLLQYKTPKMLFRKEISAL